MHRREANGDIDARPWCQGFYAAMGLRMSAWAPLLDANNINHGLLLPILLHYRDDSGRSAARSATKRRRDKELSAQRQRRYPSGRRGLAPILDADPLRTR
jgi:uncharacterized protein